jgi:hypothetical protein
VSAIRLNPALLVALLLSAFGLLLSAPGGASAATPKITLSSPANGALILAGQPDFKGKAVDSPSASGTVTIDVYHGDEAGGIPFIVLQTAVSDGSYEIAPSALPLVDGLYTAQASEAASHDFGAAIGYSNSTTFYVFNGKQRIHLNAPAAEPVTNPAPTFTGTAVTAATASTTVALEIFPGSTTNATPLEVIDGSVATSGDFRIQVEPGLADGKYTAVVAQALASGGTFSNAVHFTVAARAPGVSVTAPSASERLEAASVLHFAGGAGNRYGDSDTIHLALYAGASTSGRRVATTTVKRSGAHWTKNWSSASLRPGSYTLKVTQDTVGGDVGTAIRTFTLTQLAQWVQASSVAISSRGVITVRAGCALGVSSCAGDVLITTRKSFQTEYGGPSGPLRLMFDRFSVAGGVGRTLSAQLSAQQLAVLRRAGPQRLAVTLSYRNGGRLAAKTTDTSPITVGG